MATEFQEKQAHLARLYREYNMCIQRAQINESAGRCKEAENCLDQAASKSDLIFCLESDEMTIAEVAGR